MRVKIIGSRNFRINMTAYIKKSQDENITYIVTKQKEPLFALHPFQKELDIGCAILETKRTKELIKKGKILKLKESLEKDARAKY